MNAFQVGDKVYDILSQKWGVIATIEEGHTFPVAVDFDTFKERYTLKGEYYNNDCIRVLYFTSFQITPPPEALIRPRWRAELTGVYYYVDSFGSIYASHNFNYKADNRRYSIGNYFRTEEDARDSKFYKVFHE